MSFRPGWFSLLLAWTILSPAYAATIDKGVEIGGQVVSAAGAGVAEARVTLFPVVDKYERSLALFEGDAEPTAITRTDATGRFRLTAPEIGLWTLRLEADGYVDAEVAIRPLLGPVELPPLVLATAEELVVRVTDAEGEPVEGARVVAAPPTGEPYLQAGPALRFATTGPDGVARLATAPGESVQVIAAVPGSGPTEATVEGGEMLELVVEAGVARHLRVVDERQQPVPTALVLVGDDPLSLAATDSAGRATVYGSLGVSESAGTAPELTVLAPGKLRAQLGGRPSITDNKTSGVETVVVRPEPHFTGRIVTVDSRQPIADALVWDSAGTASARTDIRGVYELGCDAAYSTLIVAVAEGNSLGAVSVEECGTTPTIMLPRAAKLSGQVVDDAGRPLAGVAIQAIRGGVPQAGDNSTDYRLDRILGRVNFSAPDGTFHLAALAPGNYELGFDKDGFTPLERPIALLAPGELRNDLRIVLARGPTVLGRVVDEQRAPIAGVEVQLHRLQEEGDSWLLSVLYHLRCRVQRCGSEEAHFTEELGRFRVLGLMPGRYNLNIRANGFASSVIPRIEITTDRAEVDLGTLMLMAGGVVAGRVTDDTGQAIADAQVSITRLHELTQQYDYTSTDADGRFAVSDLRPGGRLSITIVKEGYSSEEITTVPTASPVEVVIQRLGRVAGRVVDEAHAPVADAEVRVDFRSARTDASGAFEITEVNPRNQYINVRAQGYRPYCQIETGLTPGRELTDLEVVLQRGAELSGEVLTADGMPATGTVVSARPVGTWAIPIERALVDGDGRYRLTNLDLTSYRIYAETTSVDVKIQAGSNTLDLRLKDGVTVSGQVLSPDGEPLSGARVCLVGGRRDRHSSCGADGTFSFPTVEAGSYTLTAAAEGYARVEYPEPVVVTDEAISELVMRLENGTKLTGHILGLEFGDLPRLDVRAHGSSKDRDHHKAQVDYQGRYVISHLSLGDWKVSAQLAESGRRAEGEITITPGMPEAVLDIDLGDDGFTLTGSVWQGDAPMRATTLTVTSGDDSYTTPTNHDGSFRLDRLASGAYRLIVGQTIPFQEYPETIVIDGDRDIRIEFDAVARISGRVLNSNDHTPIPYASIRLWPPSMELLSGYHASFTSSDSHGLFLRRNVPAGRWRLTADKEGYTPYEVEIELVGGETLAGLEIELTPLDG